MKNNLTLRVVKNQAPTEIDWNAVPVLLKHNQLDIYAIATKIGARRYITFLGGDDCNAVSCYEISDSGQFIGNVMEERVFAPFDGSIELANTSTQYAPVNEIRTVGSIQYPILSPLQTEQKDQLMVWGNHVVLILMQHEDFVDVMVVGKTNGVSTIPRPNFSVGSMSVVDINELLPFHHSHCWISSHNQHSIKG